MSAEIAASIKSKATFFEEEAARVRQLNERDHKLSLLKTPFKKPDHVRPSEQHPTGNPDLVSITGYIISTKKKGKPIWYREPEKKPKSVLPAPAAEK
jgi:hypothetical protein